MTKSPKSTSRQFPQFKGKERLEILLDKVTKKDSQLREQSELLRKLGETRVESAPGATAVGMITDSLLDFDKFIESGPKASADARKIATDVNRKLWRSQAKEIWDEERLSIGIHSTREMVAEQISRGIPLGKRPSVGTIENAIKGVKPKGKGAKPVK